MPSKNTRPPYGRIILISLALFLIAVTAILLYDAPPPDDSDFNVTSPDQPDGHEILLNLDIPYTRISKDDESTLRKLIRPISQERTPWDADLPSRLLTDNAAALEALDRSLETSNWQFQPSPTTPYQRPPDYAALSDLAQLRALQAFHHGDPHTAITHSLTLLTLAQHIEQISFQRGGTQSRLQASTVLETAVPHVSDRPFLQATLDHLQANAPGPEIWRTNVRNSYTWERDYSQRRLEELRAGNIPPGDIDIPYYFWLIYKPNVTLHQFLAIARTLRSAADHPSQIAFSTAVGSNLTPYPFRWYDFVDPNLIGTFQAVHFESGLRQSTSEIWRRRYIHLHQTLLLALHLYQLDHGHLPAALTDLVPTYLETIPPDPFNGSALHYDPDRRIISSVGENLRPQSNRTLPHQELDWNNPNFTIHPPRRTYP